MGSDITSEQNLIARASGARYHNVSIPDAAAGFELPSFEVPRGCWFPIDSAFTLPGLWCTSMYLCPAELRV